MSRHGSAEKSARLLSEKVNGSITLFDLRKSEPSQLDGFDTVIIGGSIHFGRVQDKIKRYCLKNEKVLLDKKLGLYLCCMKKGEVAQQQFIDAFPTSLRQHAEVKGIFGGEFMFEKMNFLEKMIVRQVANVKESVSEIDLSVINHFAENISVDQNA
jgi:menaquinone-dependent protoporphyrinogen oxidase